MQQYIISLIQSVRIWNFSAVKSYHTCLFSFSWYFTEKQCNSFSWTVYWKKNVILGKNHRKDIIQIMFLLQLCILILSIWYYNYHRILHGWDFLDMQYYICFGSWMICIFSSKFWILKCMYCMFSIVLWHFTLSTVVL